MLLRELLQRLEARLADAGFCRAHRQALVRTAAIKQLQRTHDGGLNAVLTSGAVIPVSRRQRAALVAGGAS